MSDRRDDVRKVPASAGAQWLLGGLALLRKAPLGLGLLGLLYGVLALVAQMSAQRNLSLFMLLQLALFIIGPLLVGGMIYAAREVDRGGRAVPGHFLQGLRDGKFLRLLATLLPQLCAVVLIMLLLVAIVGPTRMMQLATAVESMRGQAKPDPSLFPAIGFARIMLWIALTLVIGIMAGFFTFVGLPEIMLTRSGAWPAMLRSFRVCLRNLPAMIVFFVLFVIAIFAFYFVLLLLGVVVKLIAGAVAMQAVVQLLLMAGMMPVIAGAVYVAWQQMLGSEDTHGIVPASGFEA